MKHILLPMEIEQELMRLSSVEGLLLTGSQVLGKAGKNADWDIQVVLSDGQLAWRKTYLVGSEWLELICHDRAQILKRFEEEMRQGAEAPTIFMFASGQVLRDNAAHDLQKLVKRARQLWERGPGKPSKQRMSELNYAIATYLQDIEDCLEENNPAVLLIHYALNSFVRYRFELDAAWIPRAKDRMHELKKRDRRFGMLVEACSLESDWRRKAELAIDIGKDLGKRFQLSLDGSLWIPPKKNTNK